LKTTIKICTSCKSPFDTTLTHACLDAPSSDVATLPQPQIGMVIDKKYRLENKLGEGGMGSVFRARRLFIDDFVAIKFVRTEVLANPEFRQRFYQEARVAARLKHPNVVTVHDFGETPDGLIYLVMEFLAGTSLGELLKQTGPLALDRVIDIGLQICEALHCMHENNVIHRDLKPDNIMLVQDGKGSEIVKVVDFGVAKILESNARLTRYQVRIGSPVYCSPEQYLGQPVDHRTDLYGLGIIFYECLTGQVPFDALNETELHAAILNKMPPRLDEKISTVTRPTADLVQWLLAKNPNDRPRNAAEVNKCLHALRRFQKTRQVDRTPGRVEQSNPNTLFIKSVIEPAPAKTRLIKPGPTKPSRSTPQKRLKRRVFLILGFIVMAFFFIWKTLHDPTMPSSYFAQAFRQWQRATKKSMANEKTANRNVAPPLADKSMPALSNDGEKKTTAPASSKPENDPAPQGELTNNTTRLAVAATTNDHSKAVRELRSGPPLTRMESSRANRPASSANNKAKKPGASRRGETKAEKRSLMDRRLSLNSPVQPKKSDSIVSAIPAGMVMIKETEFMCGDIFGDGNPNEKPVHRVRVASFLIGHCEVTNREYLAFVKATGGHLPEWMNPDSKYHYQTGTDDFYKKLGPALYNLDHPVVGVSWQDAVTYCEWLSKKGSIKYRLPTEAEWELAARGGNNAIKYSWGNDAPKLVRGGNVGDEALKAIFPNWPVIWRAYNDSYAYTAPVGKFGANGLGIYDMTGNVLEWCSDWYDENYYQKQEWDRPTGPPQGTERVIRGGSWSDTPAKLRLSYRRGAPPTFRSNNLGFRVAASAP
jgi:formylglycine-generating enzyme required for sulfatase activity